VINFRIKIAEFVFDITTFYEDTKKMCENYLSNEDSSFSIVINQDDIEYERKKSYDEAIYEGIVPENFTDAYLETIAVYRKIAEYIAEHNATVFHGSLISLNNEGYLFTGRSGIGKTTHISNWLKVYPETQIINGDKPILKVINNELIGYGTPWSGKENYNINSSVKVKAIIEVTRDTNNHIEKMNLNDCLSLLLSQTYRSNAADGMKKALEIAIKLGSTTNLYRLGCNMEAESARVAYEGINNEH